MKKIKKIAWKCFKAISFLLIGIFIGNLIGIGILWQIKCGNTPHATLRPEDKKILFHFLGIKNMTADEKKDRLMQSEDFINHYRGEIDSAVINEIFPDQPPAYGVDSQFVINFHLKNGNPNIQIGYIAGFQDYFNPMWGICLTPFDCDGKPDKIWINSYFDEMAHAKQFYQNPLDFEFSFFTGAWDAILLTIFTNKTLGEAYQEEYSKDGSFEYEAHKEINSEFTEVYLSHRAKCFRVKIDEINKKIEEKEKKCYKKEKWTSEEDELSYKKMCSTRDSLLYGPLFLCIP